LAPSVIEFYNYLQLQLEVLIHLGSHWELSSKRHKSTQTSFYLRYSLELKKDRMMFVSTCVACWKAPTGYAQLAAIQAPKLKALG